MARLASIPRSSPDWVGRLLAELGRIKWLIHAHERLDALDPFLASDVRQIIGWNVSQAELDQTGERADDTWVVVGQWIDDDERIRTQRSWVTGRTTGARVDPAVLAGRAALPRIDRRGDRTGRHARVLPRSGALRARFVQREGNVTSLSNRPPGFDTVEDFLASVTASLVKQPWLNAFGGVLRDATIVRTETWLVRDHMGHGLPLRGANHWKALAAQRRPSL